MLFELQSCIETYFLALQYQECLYAISAQTYFRVLDETDLIMESHNNDVQSRDIVYVLCDVNIINKKWKTKYKNSESIVFTYVCDDISIHLFPRHFKFKRP